MQLAALVKKMSLFTAAKGVRLGLCLKNLFGKNVTVNFGLFAHVEGWLGAEAEAEVKNLDNPWERHIVCDQDVFDFCEYADEMNFVILEKCGGRTFWYENFDVEVTGDDATITLRWGS